MCFYIHYDHKEEKTATRDIECWKILSKDLKSLYRDFQYEVEKLYQQKNPLHVDIWDQIDKGFHSYANKATAKKRMIFTRKITRFVIPKGSKYYYNPVDEEYVSDKIILTSKWINYSIVEYFKNLRNK